MKTLKNFPTSTAKFVASTFLGFSLLNLPIVLAIANAQSPPPVLQAGLQFQESEEFNVGTIAILSVTEIYHRDSGGFRMGQSYFPNWQTYTSTHEEEISGTAAFISHTTLPAPGLRVKIRNVTSGMDKNPYPYTDREYDKAPVSQRFKVSFGTEHRGSSLVVQPGQNEFSYEIKHGNTVIESGTFTARIDRRTQSIVRNYDGSTNSFSSFNDELFPQQLYRIKGLNIKKITPLNNQ